MSGSAVFRRALILFGVISSLCAPNAFAQERGFAAHRYDGSTAGSWLFMVDRPWYSSTRFFALGVTVDGALNPQTDADIRIGPALVLRLKLMAGLAAFLEPSNLPVALLVMAFTGAAMALVSASRKRLLVPTLARFHVLVLTMGRRSFQNSCAETPRPSVGARVQYFTLWRDGFPGRAQLEIS